MEFEEKDFEAPLYSELRFGSHRIATPGQVFEGKFGIDAALEAEHPLFWDLFGFYDVPKGVVLDDYQWGFIWRKLGKKRKLPTFNTNLLIQAKRPNVLLRANKKLKKYGFSGKYWRFEVKDHQQEILEQISKNLSKKALVIYASPAFDKLDELYDFTEKQKIIDNTNFVKVERMRDHQKWNYQSPGTHGVAFSEPEEIEDISFYQMIDLLREGGYSEDNASQNLYFLSNSVVSICNEFSESNPTANYFLRIRNRFSRMRDYYNEDVYHYLTFHLFCNVFKVKWLLA